MGCRTILAIGIFALGTISSCSNEAIDDCADCPNPEFRDACLEAAADCDQFSGEDREMCLEEARALCE